MNSVVKNILNSIGAVFLPRLVSYLAKGQREEYEKLFHQGTELNLLLSVASTVGLFVLGKPIIEVFSGTKFLPAVFVGQILAIRLIFCALDNIFYNQVLIATGNDKKAFIGTTIGAIANLILNAILIPLFQGEGAAIATVISEGTVFLYFVCSTRRIVDLKLVVSGGLKYFVAARSDGSRADRRNEDCSWSCVAAGHFSAGWGCSLFYGTWNHYFGKEIFEKERLIKKQ